MSIEKVRAYLKNMNCPKEVIEFEQSSATVELAAQAAGVIPYILAVLFVLLTMLIGILLKKASKTF